MKIGYRLGIGFGILLVILIGVSFTSIGNLETLSGEVTLMVEDRFPKTVWVNDMIDATNDAASAIKNKMLTDDPKEAQISQERLDAAQQTVNDRMEKLRKTVTTPEGIKMLDKIDRVRSDFYEARQEAFDSLSAGNRQSAINLTLGPVRTTQNNYLATLEELIEYQNELVRDAGANSLEIYETGQILLYSVGAFSIIATIIIALILIKSIVSPIRKAMIAAQEISKGNLDVELETKGKDEAAQMLRAMKEMTGILNNLLIDVDKLSKSAQEGALDQRAEETRYEGDFRQLVHGVNGTLDAVVGPLNVAAEYIDRISKGDIPPKITEEYHGDFNEIKNNLNQCIDIITALTKETSDITQSIRKGQLDIRGDADRFVGDWQRLIKGINDLTDEFVGPINVTAEYVDRISKGDIPPKITDDYQGDFNEIKNNLNQCIDIMNGLLGETNRLVESVVEGQLDRRGDADTFTGGWSQLVGGVNRLVDAFVSPINVTAEYIDRISKGDIPPKITDEYKGDFNEIKNNLNQCIDAINQLITDSNKLAEETIKGRLRERADVSRHSGDFKRIIEGVNNALGSITAMLDSVPIPLMTINKDMKIQFINESGASLDNKTGSQLEGTKCNDHFRTEHCKTENCACDLSMKQDKRITQETIARPNGHEIEIEYTGVPIHDPDGNVVGSFEIVLDQTDIKQAMRRQDKVAKYQLHETDKIVDALEALAEGDFKVHVDLDDPDEQTQNAYNTLMRILTAIRKFTGAVFALQSDVNMLSEAAVEGRLGQRVDTGKHKGEFADITRGLNNTLDSIIEPINEASEVIEVLSTGDLTARVTGKYSGDHEKLKNSLNSLAESLAGVIYEVSEAVESVASAAVEMTATAEGLAAASQEQSSQSDEVASAVEEMSRTITENAMSAGKTAEEAESNQKIAREGGDIVSQTVAKMRDIAQVVKNSAENIESLGESSKKIGEIISVIDDIADQTNLLALNAAIEAARAGEQGRGFAVVADEVRKLAERTTEATKQIASMIKGIQRETSEAVDAMQRGTEEVSSGITLADSAGDALGKIVGSTQDVLDMINQIAAASEEQSSTSEEIS
ncbi:MAG: methyl-accepting chemotaxis protein, partial [Candidatus Kapaibacterium sp.]